MPPFVPEPSADQVVPSKRTMLFARTFPTDAKFPAQ
jgi:hypothetical protein